MSLHIARDSEMTARLLELSKELAMAERLAVAMAKQVQALDAAMHQLLMRNAQLEAENERLLEATR